MAKKNKRKSSFRGKTRTNASRRKHGNKYKHLSIPAGIEMWMPEKDMKYLFDILPYEVKDKAHPDREENDEIAVEGTLWYKRPYKVHNSVGANNEKVICPRSVGKSCPICDLQKEMREQEEDEEKIKKLYPSDRNLYVIVPLDDKKSDAKPHIFDFSDFMFQEKFETQLGDDDGFDYFPDVEEGLSLKVAFGESTFSKGFPDPVRFDFVLRSEQYDEAILDDVPCLDDCLQVLPYDIIKAKFFEVDIEEEEDDDEPPKMKRRPSAKRKKAEPEEDEDEEDEPAPPKRKKKTIIVTPEPEEDEDDEEEEDEPEDLTDLIEECTSIKELLTLARKHSDFFDITELKKIKKTSLLKQEMLEMMELEEEEEDEEEEEEELELTELINECENLQELLDLAREYSTVFKPHMKDLKKLKRPIQLKKAMLALADESAEDDLPFEDEEEAPRKKRTATSKEKCPSGYQFGVDTDEYDECDECDLWEACYAKQQKQ